MTKFKCPHCGCDVMPTYKTKGPHIGEYCNGCGRWVRWVPKSKYAVLEHMKPVEVQEFKDELHHYDIEDTEVPW